MAKSLRREFARCGQVVGELSLRNITNASFLHIDCLSGNSTANRKGGFSYKLIPLFSLGRLFLLVFVTTWKSWSDFIEGRFAEWTFSGGNIPGETYRHRLRGGKIAEKLARPGLKYLSCPSMRDGIS